MLWALCSCSKFHVSTLGFGLTLSTTLLLYIDQCSGLWAQCSRLWAFVHTQCSVPFHSTTHAVYHDCSHIQCSVQYCSCAQYSVPPLRSCSVLCYSCAPTLWLELRCSCVCAPAKCLVPCYPHAHCSVFHTILLDSVCIYMRCLPLTLYVFLSTLL